MVQEAAEEDEDAVFDIRRKKITGSSNSLDQLETNNNPHIITPLQSTARVSIG